MGLFLTLLQVAVFIGVLKLFEFFGGPPATLPDIAFGVATIALWTANRIDFNATATIGKPGNATAVSDPARDQHGE